MRTDARELAAAIDAVCRLQGEFTLRSGLTSPEYFDKYRFETDPVLLGRVTEAMATVLPGDTEVLGGLELGGIPIATRLSALTGLPVIFVRKEARPTAPARSPRAATSPAGGSP